MNQSAYLLVGAAIADAAGLARSPGAALVLCPSAGGPILLASGTPDEVLTHPAALAAQRIDLPSAVLLPPLVNAHTHLDLTHIGAQHYDPAQGFAGWAGTILRQRLYDPLPLRQSVRLGIQQSLRGGVVALGDISGDWRTEPIEELQHSPMLGVAFLEYFGIGARQPDVIARLARALAALEPRRAHQRVALGLQPHAPYTVGSRLMGHTALLHRDGWPLCTHLAENPHERRFIAEALGPFRDLLARLGLWDDSIMEDVGRGQRPIQHMRAHLNAAPWLLAHVNDCDEADLAVLGESGASVVYCPRSSAYFLNHESFGPHRYQDMLAAGINVALGTDSVVNLPAHAPQRISTLDEMRLLHRRDNADPRTLLDMATRRGARALGLDPALFQFGGPDRPIAGLIAVDVRATTHDAHPIERVLRDGIGPADGGSGGGGSGGDGGGGGGVALLIDPTGGIHRFDPDWDGP